MVSYILWNIWKKMAVLWYWEEGCQTLWDINCSHTNRTSDSDRTPSPPPPEQNEWTTRTSDFQIRLLQFNSPPRVSSLLWGHFEPQVFVFCQTICFKRIALWQMLPSAELCTLKDLKLYIWEPRTWHILPLRPQSLFIIRNEKNLS